jgi:hypothetical protein
MTSDACPKYPLKPYIENITTISVGLADDSFNLELEIQNSKLCGRKAAERWG